MRISEVTSSNKPYIRIVKGKKRIDIPITPKTVVLPPSRGSMREYAFVGCENIRVNYKGKIVKLNWSFNHNKMTLYCTSGRKAYCWNNVKVATITDIHGKKEHLVVSKRDFGDETERRRYKRYPFVKPVTIIQGDRQYDATSLDLSYGGVALIVKKRINLVPSQQIRVDFGTDTKILIRLVRTVFRQDGSELFGFSISQVYRAEIAKILRIDEPKGTGKDKDSEKDTDVGWSQSSIKRWH
jgi:hypothetical protein